MSDVILGIGWWVGVSLVAVFMFSLGAALGRRGAWEEGYRLGLQVGAAQAERRFKEQDRTPDEDSQGRKERQGRKAG